MRWRKLGRIFQADGQYPWMRSHTACPVPLALGEGRFRVYFGTRCERNRPRIGFVEIDAARPLEVLELSATPALEAGPRGHFDDNGVYPGVVLREGGGIRMYYPGRSNGEPPLYYMAIGLAESADGGRSFRRVRPSPVLGRGPHDPWMTTTPWILREGERWRMWYVSGIAWTGERESTYHIKYAESQDGVQWRRDGRVAIDLAQGETNLASPCVLRREDGYHMWYCRVQRGEGYRLGYAHSADGLRWERRDGETGIEPGSAGEWDHDCMAYPAVFAHAGRLHLLYSGNGNGRGGIGIAVEE